MKFQESNRRGAVLLFAALLACLSFVACGGDNSAHQQQDQVVQVTVTDQELQMPVSLPTGATTFQVKNTGSQAHSFGIVGPGGDIMLDKPLKPGETGTLDIALDAGTYRVYCPEDGNHGKPLQLALHVTPDATAPATDSQS